MFRKFSPKPLASLLIRSAVGLTALIWGDAPFITYIGVDRVLSPNPGYCFKRAGFVHIGFKEKTKLGRMARLEMTKGEVTACREELQQAFMGHLPERYR